MPSGELHKAKTHCSHGHAYDKGNTYWTTNRHGNRGRCCRECQKTRMQRKREAPDFKAREAEKMRRWRKCNPETYKERYERTYREKGDLLLEARISGCVRCGETDPACLDFHHRNGLKDKLGNIGEFRKFGIARLKAELAKCDVLCANCHRKHHRDERERKNNVRR